MSDHNDAIGAGLHSAELHERECADAPILVEVKCGCGYFMLVPSGAVDRRCERQVGVDPMERPVFCPGRVTASIHATLPIVP